MNDYQKQAADFLAKHSIKFSAKLTNKKSPPWSPDRKVNHFVVTLSKGKKRISFDFWDSQHNKQAGIETLDAYSALSCVSSDIYCADTFEEFCGDFGYNTDSRKDLATFKRCSAFAKKLNAFFTAGEKEELAEIQ